MKHVDYSGMIPDIEHGLKLLSYQFSPGLNRYVFNGVEPGGFLIACIENDLLEAICRAGDEIALHDIKAIVQFFFNDCPSKCWGSRDKRLAWQGHAGALGPFNVARSPTMI